MSKDTVGAFRAFALRVEPTRTIMVKFAFVTVLALPCKKNLAKFGFPRDNLRFG